jgi:hypothetical protein
MARWGGGPTGTFTVSQPRGAVRWSFRAALHDVRTLCEDGFSGNRRGGRRSRDTAGEPWPKIPKVTFDPSLRTISAVISPVAQK